MRGAAMRLSAAGGFIVLLLTVPVAQGQNDWRGPYTSTQICAFKGSTVEMQHTYRYPAEKTFWFTKESNNVYVDLRTDPDYSGRVQYYYTNNFCTLRITDLRESDSAVYYFSLSDGTYTASPGVTLSVTDLQIQVRRPQEYRSELTCHSSCPLPGRPSYVWYESGRKIQRQTSNTYSVNMYYTNRRFSCAVEQHENFPSPSLSMQDENGWGVTFSSPQICALKGSTVDISCTFRYPTRIKTVQDKFWFRGSNNEPVDLRYFPDYMNRVQYHCVENNCSLIISHLRESDSAEYKFRFITILSTGRYTGSPGVALSVADPQLRIHVRRSTVNQFSTWTELTCHNKCPLPRQYSYIWYKNGQKVENKKVYFHPHPLNPADNYSCAVQGYEMFPSPPVYAPKLPSVSVSSSWVIMEGSLVTLTCSSDANPAANYTWYKGNHTLISKEPQLVFSSIQSSDSGEYHCAAENELGSRTSEHIFINVKYPPKLPSVSVSPSEIVEGSSVTLTCSSDANPAANYTWYKKNQTLPQGRGGIYHFPSISSEDSEIYHCKSENEHGENSSSISMGVVYPPRLPSVSVSPSEIVEGSSVNLTCSSDANPAANYTWYKENEDSPKASGQIFTITDFRAEHSGNYYCEAQNSRGRRNSTLHLTVVAARNSAAIGSFFAVFLAVIFFSVFLLIIRKKRASKQSPEPENRPDNREKPNQSTEQVDVHYASIRFPQNQTECVYSNIRPAGAFIHEEEEEEEVEYTAVRFNSASSPLRTRDQRTVEDQAVLYSTVNKVLKC